MAIKLIGKVAYEVSDSLSIEYGEFYLTEEALRDLHYLQMKTEEAIDRAAHIQTPSVVCSPLAEIESRRNGTGESIDGPNR